MNNVRRSSAYAENGIYLGERLESYRLSHGYTKPEMAAYLGVPVQRYVAYENCTLLPGSETIVRMARTLQCTTDHLFGLDQNENRPDAATSKAGKGNNTTP